MTITSNTVTGLVSFPVNLAYAQLNAFEKNEATISLEQVMGSPAKGCVSGDAGITAEQGISLILFSQAPDGGQVPIGPGMYTVVLGGLNFGAAPDGGMSDEIAPSQYVFTPDAAVGQPTVNLTGGTVTVVSATASGFTGTFDLTASTLEATPQTGSIKGTFDVPICPAGEL
jgi:hypothetical protein